MIRDLIEVRLKELAEHVLRRQLTSLEYNLFLHKNEQQMQKLYFNFKGEMDAMILTHLAGIIDKNEDNSD